MYTIIQAKNAINNTCMQNSIPLPTNTFLVLLTKLFFGIYYNNLFFFFHSKVKMKKKRMTAEDLLFIWFKTSWNKLRKLFNLA